MLQVQNDGLAWFKIVSAWTEIRRFFAQVWITHFASKVYHLYIVLPSITLTHISNTSDTKISQHMLGDTQNLALLMIRSQWRTPINWQHSNLFSIIFYSRIITGFKKKTLLDLIVTSFNMSCQNEKNLKKYLIFFYKKSCWLYRETGSRHLIPQDRGYLIIR